MKKAHTMVEMALLLCFVVIVSITLMTIFNNQKLKLNNMSKSTLNTQSVNVKDTNLSAAKLNDKVNYDKIETAGTSALTKLGVSSETFNNAVSNVTYAQLRDAAAGDDKDVYDLANLLITQLNLKYDKVSAENVNTETLTTFIGVLNAAAGAALSPTVDDQTKSLANNYIGKVKSLLKLS